MIQFKKFTHELGLIDINSVHKIEFPFQGDAKLIEAIQPDCGCTAQPKINKGKVSMTFTDSVNSNTRKNLKDKYGENPQPFNKGVSIYLNDGRPLKVVNQKGNTVFNPDKAKIRVYISGKHIY